MHSPIHRILIDKGHQVHTIAPTASVCDAVRAMSRHGVGSLVVEIDGAVLGLIAERDLLIRCVGAGRDPRTTLVAEVMQADPVVISPQTLVGEAMSLMTDRRTRHLPVVQGSRLVGLVSIGDLTRWMTRHLQDQVEHLERYISGAYS